MGVNPGADGILRALEEIGERGADVVSATQWKPALTMPPSEDRDHMQGPADAP